MKQERKGCVELKVNGNEVEINPFVHEVIKNVVLGLISSLRLEEQPKTIELKITEL